MRKFKLDLDALDVESFEAGVANRVGTVRANAWSEGYAYTCACPADPPTDDPTCGKTRCAYTCIRDLATNCLGGGSAYCD